MEKAKNDLDINAGDAAHRHKLSVQGCLALAARRADLDPDLRYLNEIQPIIMRGQKIVSKL